MILEIISGLIISVLVISVIVILFFLKLDYIKFISKWIIEVAKFIFASGLPSCNDDKKISYISIRFTEFSLSLSIITINSNKTQSIIPFSISYFQALSLYDNKRGYHFFYNEKFCIHIKKLLEYLLLPKGLSVNNLDIIIIKRYISKEAFSEDENSINPALTIKYVLNQSTKDG